MRSGSIWNEPQDWTTGLLKGERTLMGYWETKTRPLPDNLANITLEAKANRNDRGYLVLTYEFTNVEACLDVVNRQDNSSLCTSPHANTYPERTTQRFMPSRWRAPCSPTS